jgi:transcriptional regulator of arginine metabolism
MALMLSKEQRHKRIEDIVSREFVQTQAELVEHLERDGVMVTQATVSRDITEMRLVRLPMGKGRHRYALAPLSLASDVMDELRMRFKQFVHDVDRGENILVLKTTEGHANGVAYVLDRLFRDDIVGTLAGQDTIFVTARTVLAATVLLEEFTELMM